MLLQETSARRMARSLHEYFRRRIRTRKNKYGRLQWTHLYINRGASRVFGLRMNGDRSKVIYQLTVYPSHGSGSEFLLKTRPWARTADGKKARFVIKGH